MAKKPTPLDQIRAAATGDTIKFTETVLHGRIRFGKGEIVKFEEPAAAVYFDTAFNGTELTDEEPTRTITAAELNCDVSSDGETIDLDTIIRGRQGIADGTTFTGAALGTGETGEATVDSVIATGE